MDDDKSGGDTQTHTHTNAAISFTADLVSVLTFMQTLKTRFKKNVSLRARISTDQYSRSILIIKCRYLRA